jgi:predicted P-loop ATPase
LTDKTGNRRFLPVTVGCSGREIFEKEKEIKHYIKQCWAEAYVLYQLGKIPPTPDVSLLKEIKAEQENATEMDYRIDLIREWLQGRTRVCVLSIWENALKEKYTKPTKKDSTEIGLIMQQMDGWERSTSTIYIENYGRCRGWVNEKDAIV